MSKAKATATPARRTGAGRDPASGSSFPRKRESSHVTSHVNWESRDFIAALSEEKPPRHGKLQARDYKATGKFPVVDQGQSDIAGWTDDESLVIDRGLPYVVFGDHTRAFKYVDRPFALGADGTQLLKPSAEYCPRFFYYACLQLDLPSRGYNRHFTFLKEKSLPLPPKPEQQKIAAVLWKLQRSIATQDKLLKATADLKASAMQRLFTHGLRNEPLKDTDIGPMPESWQLQSLGDVTKLERGRFTHRPRNEPRFYDGSTPFVQTGDVVRSAGRIRSHTQSLNADGVAISKVFPAGTILITIAANIGFTGILGFDSACPDSLIGITCSDDVDAEFLNYYLQTQQADMDRLAPKGTQKNINIQFLQPWPVKQPTVDEQRAIASVLATIDRKLTHHRAKRAALDSLFQTLLHQLMTGAIRVNALGIDVSEVADQFADASKKIGGHATRTSSDHLPNVRKMTARGKRRQY